MLEGFQTVNGSIYYLDPDSGGALKCNTWVFSQDENVYYACSSGAIVLSGVKDGAGGIKLRDPEGKPVAGWYWSSAAQVWFYTDSDGVLQRGWRFIDGRWYHLDNESGAMNTGWFLDDDGTWYYLMSSGQMVNGWNRVETPSISLMPQVLGWSLSTPRAPPCSPRSLIVAIAFLLLGRDCARSGLAMCFTPCWGHIPTATHATCSGIGVSVGKY